MDNAYRQQMLDMYNSRARAMMEPHKQKFAQACIDEIDARTRLEHPDWEADQGAAAREQLAQCLMIQGRLAEAQEYGTLAQLAEILSRQVALDMDDEEFCDCPDNVAVYQTETIWSEQHDAWVFDTVCQGCRLRNLTTLTVI